MASDIYLSLVRGGSPQHLTASHVMCNRKCLLIDNPEARVSPTPFPRPGEAPNFNSKAEMNDLLRTACIPGKSLGWVSIRAIDIRQAGCSTAIKADEV